MEFVDGPMHPARAPYEIQVPDVDQRSCLKGSSAKLRNKLRSFLFEIFVLFQPFLVLLDVLGLKLLDVVKDKVVEEDVIYLP